MSNVTIPNLPAVASITGTELMEVVQPGNAAQGVSRRATIIQILSAATGFVPAGRSVFAGTGLSGGGPLTADVTLALARTAVTAGTYGSGSAIATFTVDQFGRLTNAGSALIRASTIGGVPTTRLITAGTGLSGGGDLSADRTFLLTNTAVVAGTYGSATAIPVVTVDQQGRLTSVSTAVLTGGGTVTNILTGTGLSGGPVTTTGTIFLANTPVTAGTYGSGSAVATFTVDAQGRLTSAGTALVSASNIGAVPTTRLVTSGTGLSGGGDLTVDRTFLLANTAVVAGTYGSASAVATFTVDAQGRLTSASAASINVSTIGGVPTSRLITSGTGLSGGGDLSVDRTFLLANTAVVAGTYGSGTNIATLTVDAQGRITAASSTSGIQAQLGRTQTYTRAQAGAITQFSGTVAGPAILDFSISNNWAMTATSGFVLGRPTNITPGMSGVIAISQSSSGNCAVIYQSGWVSPGSTLPALTLSSGANDALTYYALSATSVVLNGLLTIA